MNIKTVTTVSGVNTVDFGNTADKFYWVKNIGDTTVYVSANLNIAAGADGVAELAAGEVVLLEDYNSKVYVLGAGKVEIHEQDITDCPFKKIAKGGDTGGDGILVSTTLYTGTEYDEITKSISELKQELIDYLGYGSDGDFIPCNADGTLGFVIDSRIAQVYGPSKTSVDSTSLGATYSIIIKNANIFAFKHDSKEIHIIAKNKNGDYVLLWCYDNDYAITNALSTTSWISYTSPSNTTGQYAVAPMCDLINGIGFNNLYYVILTKSTAYTNHFVSFGDKIFRLFGQGYHQFAVKVN